MDPRKIDHERQARVSAEREARRTHAKVKLDVAYDIVDLKNEISDLRDVIGPRHERVLLDRLDRIARTVQEQL